ncbi:hypothetical protein PanWU01x14_008660, partial [Parasponia andersonii]
FSNTHFLYKIRKKSKKFGKKNRLPYPERLIVSGTLSFSLSLLKIFRCSQFFFLGKLQVRVSKHRLFGC